MTSVAAKGRDMVRRSVPNILILRSDEFRFDVAGFADNKVVRTPDLDRIAASGVVFDHVGEVVTARDLRRATAESNHLNAGYSH